MVEYPAVELPRKAGQRALLIPAQREGVEGLVDVAGKRRESQEFLPGGGFQSVHLLVSVTEVGVNAVLQFGGAENPVGSRSDLRRNAGGRPRGSQRILNGTVSPPILPYCDSSSACHAKTLFCVSTFDRRPHIPEPLNFLDSGLITKFIIIFKFICGPCVFYTRLRITNATLYKNEQSVPSSSTPCFRFTAAKRARL